MTTETEKDWPFPWDKSKGIYDSDGPKKPTRVEIDQVWYFVSPTGDDGIDTGRARQFVACVTCDKILHHNTTGPSGRILHHHHEEHTAAPPKFVERVPMGISWQTLTALPTPTEKERDHFQSNQRWREWVVEENGNGWRVLWWENDPDEVNKRLIAWAWAIGEAGARWTTGKPLTLPFQECLEGRLSDGARCWLPRGHSGTHRDYPMTTEEILRMPMTNPEEITHAYKMLPKIAVEKGPLGLPDEFGTRVRKPVVASVVPDMPAVGDTVEVHFDADGEDVGICPVVATAACNFCVCIDGKSPTEGTVDGDELMTLWPSQISEKWFTIDGRAEPLRKKPLTDHQRAVYDAAVKRVKEAAEPPKEWVDLTGPWRHLETGLRFNVTDDSNAEGLVTLSNGVGTPIEIKREELHAQYEQVLFSPNKTEDLFSGDEQPECGSDMSGGKRCFLTKGHEGEHQDYPFSQEREAEVMRAHGHDGPKPRPDVIKNIALLMKFNLGASRIDTLRALVEVADRFQVAAEADFNGVNVFVMPGDDLESLDKNLLLALEQKEKFATADKKRDN